MRKAASLLFLFLLGIVYAQAHPMPNSVLMLDVKGTGVAAELQWPLKELQMALPDEDIESIPNTLIQRKGNWLDSYLSAHMSVTDSQGRKWTVSIRGKHTVETEQSGTGKFYGLVYDLWLQPPANVSTRHFIIRYDAIMHQLVTHKMFIKLRQDWDGGLSEKDSADADLGVLMMNISDNTIPPIIITLDEGSKWKGFRSMVSLGISHIAEGTDHLMFLLVLLLPAPLIAARGRWTKSGGTKYSIVRLVKIATAFTIGHSLTLLAGTVGWLRLPSQPVEIMIAMSILVGAIHALRPIFPGKEVLIAAGFGLIHGLAFANTLAKLNLDGGRMALSILGFNIGIELMQLFVILIFVPWLIVLSTEKGYKWIRIVGASIGIIASIGWIVSRVTASENIVNTYTELLAANARWLVLILVVWATVVLVGKRNKPV